MIIYCIKNKINGKCYIGQTIGNLEKRIKRHLKEKGCPLIHKALNKYGIDNFEINSIHITDSIEELNNLEIYYIKKYNSQIPNGYNITTGGLGGSKAHTQEAKNKIRKGLLGNTNPKGRIVSEKTRKLIGDKHKGKVLSEEHKKLFQIKRKEFYENNPHLIIKGEKCGSSKLKESEVKEIKLELNSHIEKLPHGILSKLGRKYKVNYVTIKDIYLGITWKHVLIENEIQS